MWRQWGKRTRDPGISLFCLPLLMAPVPVHSTAPYSTTLHIPSLCYHDNNQLKWVVAEVEVHGLRPKGYWVVQWHGATLWATCSDDFWHGLCIKWLLHCSQKSVQWFILHKPQRLGAGHGHGHVNKRPEKLYMVCINADHKMMPHYITCECCSWAVSLAWTGLLPFCWPGSQQKWC